MRLQAALVVTTFAVLLLSNPAAAQVKPMKKIEKSVLVPAPVPEVWKAFTTVEGVTTFFAPEARLELKLGGAFEMLFAPERPADSQGSEGCTVLSFVPGKMLSFTWNAPPAFPAVRSGGEHTFVVVELEPAGAGKTRVTLTHLGWFEGGEWDQVFAYFERAWGVVLGRLAHRFEKGPLDWKNPWTPEAPSKPK